jgi:hypothetical protein
LYWPEGRGAIAVYNRTVYALRCGSRRRVALGSDVSDVQASASFVIWVTAAQRFAGVFLPGLRPFDEPIPAGIDEISGFSFTNQRLYVEGLSAGSLKVAVHGVVG